MPSKNRNQLDSGSSEEKKELEAIIARIGIVEQRKILVSGLYKLRAMRVMLVVGGAVALAYSALPFFAGLGQLLPLNKQLFLDFGLVLGAGGLLAPIWMRRNFAKVHEMLTDIDRKEQALGSYGLGKRGADDNE
jgi:hypothetical protein